MDHVDSHDSQKYRSSTIRPVHSLSTLRGLGSAAQDFRFQMAGQPCQAGVATRWVHTESSVLAPKVRRKSPDRTRRSLSITINTFARHDVLIKTADGRIVETGFEDDDFNVYPANKRDPLFRDGRRVQLRYLPHFPQDFVIRGEDDSPWANDPPCAKLYTAGSHAERKLKFAPDVPAYRTALDAAKRAEAIAGCLAEEAD